MNLPFTAAEFLAVFERYNEAIWPLQVVAYALGLAAVVLAIRPRRHSDRIIAGTLAFFWLWMGAVYHLVYFRQINPIAMAFGALFIIQGLIWLHVGVVHPRLRFDLNGGVRSLVGATFVLYALLAYPLIGALLGHGYPRSPSFGVAPCPTTIFTFGLLLWTSKPVPKHALAIPFLWSVLGLSAAISLGIWEDVGLTVAAVLGTTLLIWRDRRTVWGGVLRRRHA